MVIVLQKIFLQVFFYNNAIQNKKRKIQEYFFWVSSENINGNQVFFQDTGTLLHHEKEEHYSIVR